MYCSEEWESEHRYLDDVKNNAIDLVKRTITKCYFGDLIDKYIVIARMSDYNSRNKMQKTAIECIKNEIREIYLKENKETIINFKVK